MLGDDTQDTVHTYDLFKSELTAGSSTQGQDLDYIRHDDVNNQCGLFQYQFAILDETGEDVTELYSHIFTFSMPADPAVDPAVNTQWSVSINDANNELVADTAFVFALVGVYVNLLDGSTTDPTGIMTTTIFAVQAEMEPLIDVTPFIEMIDTTLAMIDPWISGYFYHGFVAGFLVFGLAIPGVVTTG